MASSGSEAEPTTAPPDDAGAEHVARLYGDVASLLAPGALASPMADVVAGLATRLVARGLPADRLVVTVGTVHPLVLGRSWIWRADAPVEELTYGHDALEAEEYRGSPNQILFERGGEVRWRLAGPDAERERAFVVEMADAGFTDYFGLRLSSPTPAWLTAATRAPGGFTDDDLARLRNVAATAGLVVEAQMTREIARTVLETYVGREAGERVLAGEIRRGHYQHRIAVIWLSDLRGFTAASETLAAGVVVALLNDYFERMAAAVRAHGGEILKFVGDAMLAIFPAGDDAAAACGAAVAAAREAIAAVAAWNASRAGAGDPAVRFGIALHLGDVVYGNIGGTDRLDFTVVGAAVNRAARIEALTSTLGHPVLVSETVARHADGLVSCGRHRLRDVPAPVELFTLASLPER